MLATTLSSTHGRIIEARQDHASHCAAAACRQLACSRSGSDGDQAPSYRLYPELARQTGPEAYVAGPSFRSRRPTDGEIPARVAVVRPRPGRGHRRSCASSSPALRADEAARPRGFGELIAQVLVRHLPPAIDAFHAWCPPTLTPEVLAPAPLAGSRIVIDSQSTRCATESRTVSSILGPAVRGRASTVGSGSSRRAAWSALCSAVRSVMRSPP